MHHWILAVLLSLLFVPPAQAAPRSELFREAKAGTALIVAINDQAHSVSMGSGFFVNDEGLLVTNAHVIEDSPRLYVYVHDQVVHTSPEVVAVDPDLDLAALRIAQSDIDTLALALDSPTEGTDVIAVGYPRITDILQMGFALHATVGTGTVGGIAQGRSRTTGRLAGFIQTTGILNFGNSGGPLMNLETGEVAGMVVTTVPYLERAKDRSGAAIGSVTMKSGIGYSIPAPVIRRWLTSQHLAIRPPEHHAAARPQHGADPEADRSFATGHLLHTIAMVLHQDADLLRLAISHYETAAALKPDAVWMVRNLGQAYGLVGRWDEALEAYQKGLEQAPHDAGLLSDAGVAWHRTGRKERAVESARGAVLADPRSGRAHNNLGHLLWEIGRLDDAILEFQEAIRLEPGFGLAVYNLGLALEAKGLPGEAIHTWESFLGRKAGMSHKDEWVVKMRDSVTRLSTASQAPFQTLANSAR